MLTRLDQKKVQLTEAAQKRLERRIKRTGLTLRKLKLEYYRRPRGQLLIWSRSYWGGKINIFAPNGMNFQKKNWKYLA